MDRSPTTPYAPAKLRASHLRTPVTPQLKDLPPDLRDELHQRRAAIEERLDPFSETGLRRILTRTARAGFAVVLATWMFTPIGLASWWAVLLCALVFGALMATRRFSMLTSGQLMAALGLLLMLATGHGVLSFLGVLSIFGFFAAGTLVGLAEDLAASDGE